MKLLKKIIKYGFFLLVILSIGIYFFSKTLKPTYKGELELKNLQDKVEVFYDTYGLPHIYAENELDARRALGFVHAQDRLWQMELIRRIAAGRLAELFGEELIRTDKFFSGLGIEEAAKKDIASLDKNGKAYQLTMAYLDGVNQYINTGPKPIEFYLLGVEKEEYTLKDIYNVFGYLAISFAEAHKTDPLVSEIKEKLGLDYLQELHIPIDNITRIKNEKNPMLTSKLAAAINTIYAKLPLSPFIGSNSWVIAPDKTKNGKVIFANDPHIGFAQPSVWYQSHIKTPTYESYGYNIALLPFPLLAHNRQYAYGLTMFENDDIDFYFEENNPKNPNEYKTPNGLETYQIRKKQIKVKDGETIKFQIKVSKHGPIMNSVIDHIKDDCPIAMDWVYTKHPNKIIDVMYALSHSSSLETFKQAAGMIHAPGLNVMYGDADNNIAWFASAKLYKYKNDINRFTILNGNSTDDQITYLDFSENPQGINPSCNYVYSANNQPDSIAGILYPGYYLPEDRAKRIVNLLEAKNDFTQQDVLKMITDVTSSTTPSIIKNILSELNEQELSAIEKEAFKALQKWDGSYHLTDIAPAIYNRFLYEFLVRTYKDEMGSSFQQFINTPLQRNMNAVQLSRDISVWWDDILTKDKKETKKDIVRLSYKEAILFLEKQLGGEVSKWTWNRVHTLEHKHPIGKIAALRKYFNVGPFPINGGSEVINNLSFKLDSTGYYKVTSGPSTRRVVDFSNVENAKSIIPTGQSGNILSRHYKDQSEKFNTNEFVPMLLNKEAIQNSEDKLLLVPKG